MLPSSSWLNKPSTANTQDKRVNQGKVLVAPVGCVVVEHTGTKYIHLRENGVKSRAWKGTAEGNQIQ